MNYAKALMGIILFASINTCAMNRNDDNKTDRQQAYGRKLLRCGICKKLMSRTYETVKKVYHKECIKTLAHCPEVDANPIITSQPWLALNKK